MPFKLILRVVFGVSGAVGITSKAIESSATTGTSEMLVQETPALCHVPEAKVHGVGTDTVPDQIPGMESADRDWIIDKIGEIVEDNEESENLDVFIPEERLREAEIPSNTKKRMFEATPEVVQRPRDEL